MPAGTDDSKQTYQPAFFLVNNTYAVATRQDFSVALKNGTANPVTVTAGNVPATVYGAALASVLAAVYQVAIQIPASLADGDYAVVATVGGAASPVTTMISVQH